eukprot:6205367-Pleurochrysis_carterae.AAC.5
MGGPAHTTTGNGRAIPLGQAQSALRQHWCLKTTCLPDTKIFNARMQGLPCDEDEKSADCCLGSRENGRSCASSALRGAHTLVPGRLVGRGAHRSAADALHRTSAQSRRPN